MQIIFVGTSVLAAMTKIIVNSQKCLKQSVINMLIKLYPLPFCESIEAFESILLILPKPSLRNIKLITFIFILYLLILADGLFYQFINTRYLFIAISTLGPFLFPIHIVWSAAFFEATVVRIHCLYKVIRFGRSSVTWYDIAKRIKKDDHPVYFKICRFLFIVIFFAGTSIISSQHLLKLAEYSTPLDYFVNFTWTVIQIYMIRFALTDLIFIYIAALNCYMYLINKMDDLLNTFNQPFLNIDCVPQYITMMRLINNTNSLMRLISLVNGLTVIPFFSGVLIMAITYPENSLQVFIKYFHVIPGILFGIRGVIMTIVLARIDYRSKYLHQLIASRIARGNVTGFVTRRQLLFIMEDLSSDKNHLVMREYSGSPSTEMDVMMNVFSIAQFCMLLMDFSVDFFL